MHGMGEASYLVRLSWAWAPAADNDFPVQLCQRFLEVSLRASLSFLYFSFSSKQLTCTEGEGFFHRDLSGAPASVLLLLL